MTAPGTLASLATSYLPDCLLALAGLHCIYGAAQLGSGSYEVSSPRLVVMCKLPAQLGGKGAGTGTINLPDRVTHMARWAVLGDLLGGVAASGRATPRVTARNMIAGCSA